MWKAIASAFLKLGGWTVVGEKPPVPRSVIIGAPHTSNWDGIYLVLTAVVLGINLRWLVKNSLYQGPLRFILARTGAVPIDRAGGGNVVEQAAQILRDGTDIHLALAPEGTRTRTEGWKSGFYYIALRAKVPIYFGFIDYKRRQVGIGGHLEPTGDLEADIEKIRAFYEPINARFPERYGPIKVAPRKSRMTAQKESAQSDASV